MPDERLIAQWYGAISENERKTILAGIRGTLSYNLTVSWHLLPMAGKEAVRAAYEQNKPLYEE